MAESDRLAERDAELTQARRAQSRSPSTPVSAELAHVLERTRLAVEANRPSDAAQARDDAHEAAARRREMLTLAKPAVDPSVMQRLVRGDAPIPSKAMRVVRKWHELRLAGKQPPRWVILLGGTGAGKTVAAAWMLAREPGRYVISEELVRWHRRDDLEWWRARNASLLVIDDVGTEVDHDLARAMFFATMNHRVASGWTLVTSNKTKAEFLAWIDERMTSRLMQYAVLVDCRGPDLRKPGASPWAEVRG